ncbi:VWA domain-containing protein [Shewanella nanhaiensis]|uniref:VWA domain-containing protein n=1 Tax=Shewanella nanhaiensis TaxID=2864872 RepID=A0ABS7DXR6_9GAMM|nr:VWA domain-containing protein [Shewanella nanhaiensis]MBW8182223.1 VWA domain-containing protein [Shewanella nanhaiensis]
MLHFLRPEWFLALLPLLIILILIWKAERVNSTWSRYISPHLANFLVSKSQQVKRSNLSYLAASWFIAVLALSGPAISKQSLPVFEAAQGRVILMDMSLSMYATDQAPNRLTQAKFKATDLIEALTEGETGLIAYAGDAFTISPLTRDRATLLNLLPTLSPQIMPVRGSNLPAALEQGKSLLAQGGHIQGDIILLADGVSTSQMNAAKKVLKGTQYRLSILAFGSEQGSPIRLPDGQLLRDNSNQVVVAKTDYSLLNELVQNADGILVPFRSDGADLEQLTQWLNTSSDDTKATDLNGEAWQDAGPYIALLLLLPVLLSFRHGLIASLLVLTVYQPSPVMAATWDDLWKTKDQQGMQAYQAEDYSNASTTFTDPQWQASAHYKAGEYDEALSLFEQDNSASGLYNQGNSLMQKGEFELAAQRYSKALELDPKLDGANENLELAKKLEQEKRESPEKSDNSDKSEQGEEGDQQDKQSDQSNSEQGQDQEQKQQDQNGEQDNQEQQGDQQQNSEQSDSQQNEQQSSKDNDAQMQADPNEQQQTANDNDENQQAQNSDEKAAAKDDESKEEQTAQAQAMQQEQNEQQGEQQQTQAAQAVTGPEELPPEMERAMRALVDDPQVLLRNKMQLEYQKRRMQGLASKEQEQW